MTRGSVQAEGRKAKEQVTQLVAVVQRLRMRYGVVKEKLGRANDRLKRQQQDLRDARHTSQALAAEVRKAQDATRAAVTEARHRAREAANHHAFQIAQVGARLRMPVQWCASGCCSYQWPRAVCTRPGSSSA